MQTGAVPVADLVAKAAAVIVRGNFNGALAVTRGLPEFRAGLDRPTVTTIFRAHGGDIVRTSRESSRHQVRTPSPAST